MTNLCILRIVTTITYTPVTEPQLAEYYASKGLDTESLEYGLILYRSRDRPLAPNSLTSRWTSYRVRRGLTSSGSVRALVGPITRCLAFG